MRVDGLSFCSHSGVVMAKPCTCSIKNGVRVDKDGLPMWHKMEGCPACDWQIYTPDISPDTTKKPK